MRVGNVIDRSFELLRREWRAAVLLGLIMIVGSIALFFGLFAFLGLSLGDLDPNFEPEFDEAVLITGMVMFFVVVVLFAIVSYVATGIATRAAAHGPEEGTGWSELGEHSWPALRGAGRLFGWGLLLAVAVSVVFGALIVPMAVLGDEAGAFVALLFVGAMILFVLGAIGLAPVFMVLVAAVFVDDASVPASLRKAWDLVRRAYWPALGATIVLWLFSLVPFVGSLLVTVLTPSYQVALMEELEAS